MAEGPNTVVPPRRRREGRTNYKKRLEMLKSGDHRAVIRISNKHAEVQITQYTPDGDDVTASAVSQQLESFGWDQYTGNMPAAYLTGLLAGYRALDAGVTRAIPDFGVQDQQYDSRYYAAVRGLQDAGLDVPADDVALPSNERVNGEHAAHYESEGADDAVETVREQIMEEYGE